MLLRSAAVFALNTHFSTGAAHSTPALTRPLAQLKFILWGHSLLLSPPPPIRLFEFQYMTFSRLFLSALSVSSPPWQTDLLSAWPSHCLFPVWTHVSPIPLLKNYSYVDYCSDGTYLGTSVSYRLRCWTHNELGKHALFSPVIINGLMWSHLLCYVLRLGPVTPSVRYTYLDHLFLKKTRTLSIACFHFLCSDSRPCLLQTCKRNFNPSMSSLPLLHHTIPAGTNLRLAVYRFITRLQLSNPRPNLSPSPWEGPTDQKKKKWKNGGRSERE